MNTEHISLMTIILDDPHPLFLQPLVPTLPQPIKQAFVPGPSTVFPEREIMTAPGCVEDEKDINATMTIILRFIFMLNWNFTFNFKVKVEY